MSTVRRFEDFEAFTTARDFVRATGTTIRQPVFRPERQLRWQIEKALISILSNFAEGFERNGRQEFIQFLTIAKGSTGEVKAQLIYAFDQGLLDGPAYQSLVSKADCTLAQFGGLLKYLIEVAPDKAKARRRS
ncbi:MAG: four helix bundle protein [Verrucomicrobia bacterium]|nr:four helix bundle protein [Verrucomicrobiota bacterium]